MDNINDITVRDGKLVTIRGGLQYSKQTHQGLTFVNSSLAGGETADPPSNSAVTLPIHTKVSFLATSDGRSRVRKAGHAKKGRTAKTSKTANHSDSYSLANKSSASLDTIPMPVSIVNHEIRNCNLKRHRELPAWTLYDIPNNLPAASKRLLHITLTYAPITAYPFYEHGILSHNPLKGPAAYLALVEDSTNLLCALTIGALYDTVRSGRKDSPELVLFTSQLYAFVNEKLSSQDQSRSVANTTMNTVSVLAMISGYLGKHDHWHIHMRGLMRLIDMAGGQDHLDPPVMAGIRKADMTGAIAASTNPYLPWMKRQAEITCPLIHSRFTAIRNELRSLLAPCGVDIRVIDNIAYAAAFHKCVVNSKKDQVVHDPFVLADNYDQMVHELLSTPRPLRNHDELVSPTATRELAIEIDWGSYSRKDAALSQDELTQATESALRILTILFLREPTTDLPCGEDVMIWILESHVRTITLQLKNRGQPHGLNHWPQKPVFIWLGIAGNFLSTLHGAISVGQRDSRSQATVYRDLLQHVLTPAEMVEPELVSDQDLAVCRILDLRYLTGEIWDKRAAIKHTLGLS
ncbi:hypothetical protein BJ170DRAFT_92149 [Xylariales sp. AK1849]|nr:hypothetical protein BJ170DRAFT_92149 [Xylariales sp. AK1849]